MLTELQYLDSCKYEAMYVRDYVCEVKCVIEQIGWMGKCV